MPCLGWDAVFISLMPFPVVFSCSPRDPHLSSHGPDCIHRCYSINTSHRTVPEEKVAFLWLQPGPPGSTGFLLPSVLSSPWPTTTVIQCLKEISLYSFIKYLFSVPTVFLAPSWRGWSVWSYHLWMYFLNSSGTCDICPAGFVKHTNQRLIFCPRDRRNWQSEGVSIFFFPLNSCNIKLIFKKCTIQGLPWWSSG